MKNAAPVEAACLPNRFQLACAIAAAKTNAMAAGLTLGYLPGWEMNVCTILLGISTTQSLSRSVRPQSHVVTARTHPLCAAGAVGAGRERPRRCLADGRLGAP